MEKLSAQQMRDMRINLGLTLNKLALASNVSISSIVSAESVNKHGQLSKGTRTKITKVLLEKKKKQIMEKVTDPEVAKQCGNCTIPHFLGFDSEGCMVLECDGESRGENQAGCGRFIPSR